MKALIRGQRALLYWGNRCWISGPSLFSFSTSSSSPTTHPAAATIEASDASSVLPGSLTDLGLSGCNTTFKSFEKTLKSETSLCTDSDAPKPVNYFSQTKQDLTDIFKSIGESPFREKQLRSWVYDKGITNLSDMKDLPISCRQKLSSLLYFGNLYILKEQVSKDGTRKRAYALQDSQIIESVLMPYRDGRNTACISSQVGCAMACSFCATGQMGFSRNLSSAEIFEQVAKFSVELKSVNKRLSNVVFMGMGEPLLNIENVVAACKRINEELGISMRNITISTVGIVPRIYHLADLEATQQINLAISLHQANNERRGKLMPVNKKYPIEDLMEACKYYISKTNRRISFEWALIDGETDTLECANMLGSLLRDMLCHVNVIPLNPTKGFGGRPSSEANVSAFVSCLNDMYGVPTTVRVRRGIDIDAGCGQLTADLLKKRRAMTKA